MDELEVEERARQLQALQQRQEMIRLENSMLSEHLSRVVSRKGSLQLHLEKLEQEQADVEEASDSRTSKASSRTGTPVTSRGLVRFSAVPPPQPELAVPLSVEEKCEIAEDECAYLEQYLERLRTENDRCLDDLRAVLKEAKLAIGESRKERTDFGRDVLLLASLNKNNKPYSEDILCFIEMKLKSRRNLRDSIKTNNARLHDDISMLESQFNFKKDLKDVLHAVDFDQLKILNHELSVRMRDRIEGIHQMKTVIKSSLKALAETQKELTDTYKRGLKLRGSLRDRLPVVKSAKESIAAERSHKMSIYEAVVLTIQNQDGPPQPTAMEYMKTQDKAVRLFKEIRRWSGKVEIAELTGKALEKSSSLMRAITA